MESIRLPFLLGRRMALLCVTECCVRHRAVRERPHRIIIEEVESVDAKQVHRRCQETRHLITQSGISDTIRGICGQGVGNATWTEKSMTPSKYLRHWNQMRKRTPRSIGSRSEIVHELASSITSLSKHSPVTLCRQVHRLGGLPKAPPRQYINAMHPTLYNKRSTRRSCC